MSYFFKQKITTAFSSWRNWIHLIISNTIALIIVVAFIILKYKEDKFWIANSFLIFGVTNLFYAILWYIGKLGFGSTFFRYRKQRKNDYLSLKLEDAKHKKQTPEQKIKVKELTNRIEKIKKEQQMSKLSRETNNWILIILFSWGLIITIIGIILSYVK
ncbi:hypothetical protein [Mycoplasmopsis gallinarum]|uniref:hypothetical protein n=1 Tax=Mycoplasmopsis gallinarum TaxID=29557 RepID=UPI000488DF0E|nr:hypothetical protein [Mycoplasmopsis gallinarum]